MNQIIVFGESFPIIELKYRPKFMLARHVAKIFNVETKHINKAVQRNSSKFPATYCFQLTDDEKDQVCNMGIDGVTKASFTRARPKAFSWKGINMLATCLKSDVAVQRSIHIIETFTAIEKKIAEQKQIDAENATKFSTVHAIDNIPDMQLIFEAMKRASNIIKKQQKKLIDLSVENEENKEKVNVLEGKTKVMASEATFKSCQQKVADHYGVTYRDAMHMIYDKFKEFSKGTYGKAVDLQKEWKAEKKNKGQSGLKLYKFVMYTKPEYGDIYANSIAALLSVEVDQHQWGGFDKIRAMEKRGRRNEQA